MTWALVTGGSARGGAAISRALHAAGLNVIVHHSSRSLAEASALLAELIGLRADSAVLWAADLASEVDVPEWMVRLSPAHCICNASVYLPSEVGDTERCAQDMAIHVVAHARMLAALRTSLRSVVAVSDIHVGRPARGHVWYTVAKAGLQALMLTLAVDWAPDVRCNVVAPGSLPFPESWTDTDREQAVLQSIPLGRIGEFSDLASAVTWLTLHATYVTGAVIPVDGGRSRWLP